jgi:hypothetical protein
MKIKREIDYPFPDKKVMRVTELIDGEIKHAWLVIKGEIYGEWHGGSKKDWIPSINVNWVNLTNPKPGSGSD